MELRDDWGELAFAVSGISGLAYAYFNSEVFTGMLGVIILIMAYTNIRLREKVRDMMPE